MPVITYIANDMVETENKLVLPAIIEGAYEDALFMWLNEEKNGP